VLFSELPLYQAISRVRKSILDDGDKPGAEEWFIDDDKRKEFCRRVITEMIDVDAAIIKAAMQFRKGTCVDGFKKIELMLLVAELHGGVCFYASRGLGPCSDDVQLDRIIPGSRGGKYSVSNCVLACGAHNSLRGDLSIEEFFSKSDPFVSAAIDIEKRN
jgi:hypothetical protein